MTVYDIERMETALKTPVTEVIRDLTREEVRQLILVRAPDAEEVVKYGDAAFDYYKTYGVFPTSRDQLEEGL